LVGVAGQEEMAGEGWYEKNVAECEKGLLPAERRFGVQVRGGAGKQFRRSPAFLFIV